MRRWTIGFLFLAGVSALALPRAASAQIFDHLSCMKVKDSSAFKALVTMDALQDQFDPTGQCSVVGKAKWFCGPSAKRLDLFSSADGSAAIGLDGQELHNDYLCYKMACPKQVFGSELVTDQFTSRDLVPTKIQFLCAPAIKGPAPSDPSSGVVDRIAIEFGGAETDDIVMTKGESADVTFRALNRAGDPVPGIGISVCQSPGGQVAIDVGPLTDGSALLSALAAGSAVIHAQAGTVTAVALVTVNSSAP